MLRAAWTLAIEALSWMELLGLSERLALAKAGKQLGIENPEVVGLAHRMVCETVRRQNFIDFLINSASAPRSLEDFKLGLQAFLRLYAYETKIVNGDFGRAVKIARMGRSILGWRELQGIEETLGEILSTQPNRLLKELGDEERVGFLTFHPAWFVKYCFRLLGRKEALRFLESAIEVTPIYVRINTLKAPEEKLLRRIEADGIILEKVPQLRHAYKVISNQQPLTKTKSHNQGLFYIQDKASCLAVEIASPRPEATILDVCAAPGAKTTYLAQLMDNAGVICSIDYSRRRTATWKRAIHRMGVKIASPIIADARQPLPVRSPVDLVVLDPPCTGTGTFAKTPSAKWRLTDRSMLNMSKVQWNMLEVCSEYVGEGGCLVYSTCSVAVEENEVIIERFLKWHPDFKLVDAAPRIGLMGLRGLIRCQRLYPHLHGCNGFFVAKLLKT